MWTTTNAKQTKAGVLVDEVRSGSSAEKAGIKTGDQIVEFDGERVRSVRQFTRIVQDTPVGRKVPVVVTRAGQRMTLTVAPDRGSDWWSDDEFSFVMPPPAPPTPPEAPEAPMAPRAVRPFPPMPAMPGFGFTYRSGGGRLGITVEDLTDGLSDYFGVKHGALVRSVTDGSPAAKAGLKAGDVITAVNGSTVEEPSDVSRALRSSGGWEGRLSSRSTSMRDKKPQTLKGKLEPHERSRARTIV